MATAADANPDSPAMPPLTVDVQLACAAAFAPDRRSVAGWITNALTASGRMPGREAEIAVRIVTGSEMQQLNAEYRGQNRATNVLAFPAEPPAEIPLDVPVHLGDIVVCADVVAAESRQQGKALADHWAHMLVHGTLHLLGFDHGDAEEAAAMEGLETRILAAGGIADPYASR